MKSENDIRNCTTDGIPNECLANPKLAEEHYEKIKIRNLNNFVSASEEAKSFNDAFSKSICDGLKVGYESPITMIASQIEMKMENDVLQAIQRYDIQADKEELIKALNYDRQQYDKGYRDAQSKLKPMCKYLGKCMSHPDISREYYDWCDLYREDCNCQCCSK